ncbi:MAG: dioxygenase [Thermoanaerobaculia bacterium]|nr:dioxygenase [Thermoanaerobaculia bacterium]
MKVPALFVSHGAPDLALRETAWGAALREFAAGTPRPTAAVVVSAHWEAWGPVLVTSTKSPETIHDFAGFPAPLYEIEYPAPGEPALAARIVGLLRDAGIAAETDPRRGLDHGAWVPLRLLAPEADVPIVAVSLPQPRTPASVLAAGRALAPLRDEGILLFGSGGMVHNLRLLEWEERDAPPPGWAAEFEAWVRGRLGAGDTEALLGYREKAPHAPRAHPTTEHFDPIFFALGAADGDRARSVFEGFEMGSLSLGSVAFGR